MQYKYHINFPAPVLLGSLLLICIIQLIYTPAARAGEKGIYALGWRFNETKPETMDALLLAVLDLDYVEGLHLYISWRSIEPENDQFNWQPIDRALTLAKSRGKSVSIGIIHQTLAPDWLMNQVPTYEFEHFIDSIGVQETPVPWNPYYKQEFFALVQAMGNRYNGNNVLKAVQISGPSSLWGVEVNFPVRDIEPEDSATLGFSHALFAGVWRQYIGKFHQAFPDTPLALALHHDITVDGIEFHDPRNIDAASNIRNYALLLRGDELLLKLAGLNLNRPNYFPGDGIDSPYTSLISPYTNSNEFVFECARIYKNSGYSQSEFIEVMENGIDYGGDYVEVKIPDMISVQNGDVYEPYAEILRQANQALKQ